VPAFQLPVASHVCDLLLLQRVAPGTQLPVHAPPLQTDVHWMPVVGHFPFASQVSNVFPLHDLPTLGVQTAPHCPEVIVPLSQVPWLLHVCGMVPEQFEEPGAQTPLQAPLTQACPEHTSLAAKACCTRTTARSPNARTNRRLRKSTGSEHVASQLKAIVTFGTQH